MIFLEMFPENFPEMFQVVCEMTEKGMLETFLEVLWSKCREFRKIFMNVFLRNTGFSPNI